MNLAQPMKAIDGLALRVAAVAVVLSFVAAALAVAWAQTTRTTSAPAGDFSGVYRENLVTGEAEFCLLSPEGEVLCFKHERPAA